MLAAACSQCADQRTPAGEGHGDAAVLTDGDVPQATATSVLAGMRPWLQTLHASVVASSSADKPAALAAADAHRAYMVALYAHASDMRYDLRLRGAWRESHRPGRRVRARAPIHADR